MDKIKTKKVTVRFMRIAVAVGLIFVCIISAGCNDGARIWAQYLGRGFEASVRYESEGVRICANIVVCRDREGSSMSVEFSSPAAIKGGEVEWDGERCVFRYEGLETEGESAVRIMNILGRFVTATEADDISFSEYGGRSFCRVCVGDDKIFFDSESGEPMFAEFDLKKCEIIAFRWK